MIFGLILWSEPSSVAEEPNVGLILFLIGLLPLVLYCGAIVIDSWTKNESLKIGLLSVRAAFIQLFGYGLGFMSAWYQRCMRGRDEFHAFDKTFYK